MGVKIDIDPDDISDGIEAQIDAGVPILTSEILKDVNLFVKRDQDTMMNSAQTATDFDNGVIVYNTKYARRQYYTGKARNRDKYPRATTRWFRVAKDLHRDQWAEQAQVILTNGGG